MFFIIQASCPRFTGVFNSEAESLSDAIESSFPLLTENLVMVWNYIPILLSYKYDISIMIDDILDVLEVLRVEDSGTKTIHWASNTFAHIWYLSWESTQLVIKAAWGSESGGIGEILENSGNITLTKQSFSSEWKKVLQNLITALNGSGYSDNELSGMARLVHEYETIETEGRVYQ